MNPLFFYNGHSWLVVSVPARGTLCSTSQCFKRETLSAEKWSWSVLNTSNNPPPQPSSNASSMPANRRRNALGPVQCEICGQKIAKIYDLSRHIRLHAPKEEKEKWMHHCKFPGCEYQNLQRSNVVNHARRHSANPFMCPEDSCEYRNYEKGCVLRHRKAKHGYVPKKMSAKGTRPTTDDDDKGRRSRGVSPEESISTHSTSSPSQSQSYTTSSSPGPTSPTASFSPPITSVDWVGDCRSPCPKPFPFNVSRNSKDDLQSAPIRDTHNNSDASRVVKKEEPSPGTSSLHQLLWSRSAKAGSEAGLLMLSSAAQAVSAQARSQL
ncbi:hypothetical protein BV25DRAFT_1628101 [Artomyces pyxidatus]|uniref:Uncharacterized protein n=1 Tax=Artomyces pyxidatus TaxID=48021 RepID=A0ACB8SJS1_9AGAM|nr:hypothetical protein BV25DRAFT_1628101 [Artomyces pyxidatus]